MPDRVTKRWIMNTSDERAASDGMRFEESRVEHLFRSLTDHIVLWEGESAGRPWRPLDWHWEVLGSIFGWVRWDDFFGRWVRRFRVGSVWIGKKNGKSPTGAAVGLYLLKFDGEPGQQVYSAGRDGKQAMIVHGNAINMVKNSESLSAELKINKATGRIVWEAGNSVYAPMSADNFMSQEGKNGSVIIDEAHTVDDRLGRILADMGASRAESLRFEISTGGEGVESYGRKQWEHGMDILAGRVYDPTFYFKAYAVSPETPDEKLCAMNRQGKPKRETIKLWKQANPALGEILSIEELTHSCKRAHAMGESEWSAFKARRLNIWQKASSPWLSKSLWENAQTEIEYEGLRDVGGGIGLDLSRVADMTAAVAVLPLADDHWHMVAMFWIPEGRVDRLAGMHIPMLPDWSKSGQITVTPGEVTDYEMVRDGIRELINHTGVTCLAFDRLFAMEMANQLEEETQVECIEFSQTYTMYSQPCADFKRMLMDKELTHDGNEVLTWQAGHCLVREIGDGRMKPVKEKGKSWRTIDGIQAAVMGLAACQKAPELSLGDDSYVNSF